MLWYVCVRQPLHILTICPQVRSLLSSQASWSVKDGHYNGQEFMYSLLCAFAQDPAWSDKVLDWWTRYVLTRATDLLTDEIQ